MAKGWEADIWEDDVCMECGADHYVESKIPGVCKDCSDEIPTARALPEDES
jgi:hypothetical protein